MTKRTPGCRPRSWTDVLRTSALALVVGCTGPQTQVVAGPGFVLHSPFAQESTEDWRRRVSEEIAAVAELLRLQLPDPPVLVEIEAVEDPVDAGLPDQLNPRVGGGIGGWAIAGDAIHVVVGTADDGRYSTQAEARLRHELAHVLVHRMGMRPASWFDEGLAHEIEDAVHTPEGLRLDPVPLQLVLARTVAPTFDCAEVWSWDQATRPHDEREVVLRALARSFVRFLIERERETPWPFRLPEMASCAPQDDREIVEAWRRWLDAWDVADRIAQGIEASAPSTRRAAAARLPELADLVARLRDRIPGIEASVDERRLDAIALHALADPASQEPAARYLVFFRAHALPVSAIEELTAASGLAGPRVVGLALRVRRGENLDTAKAQSSWQDLTADEQRRLEWVRRFLRPNGSSSAR